MPWDPVTVNRTVPTERVVLTAEVLEGLQSGTIVVSDVSPTIPGIDEQNIYQYALDCIWAVVETTLDVSKFSVAMKATGYEGCLKTVLTNLFVVVWLDIEGPTRQAFYEAPGQESASAPLAEEEASRLVELLLRCRLDKLVDDAELITSLDIRMLIQANMMETVGGKPLFCSRMNNIRIHERYKTHRYNIFVEETEGFAKLLTLLSCPSVRTYDADKLEYSVQKIVGNFSLSTMKAASCVLNAIESAPSSAETLLKLSVLTDRGIQEHVSMRLRYPGNRDHPRTSLFTLFAILISRGRLTLTYVLRILDAEITALPATFCTANSEEYLKTVRATAEEARGHSTSSDDFVLSIGFLDAAVTDKIGSCQPVQLLCALLRVKASKEAFSLMRVLSNAAGYSMLSHREVGLCTLQYLDSLLAPAHKALYPNGRFGVCLLPSTNNQIEKLVAKMPVATPLSEEIVRVLKLVGPYCFRQTTTLSVLLRSLRHILITHATDSQPFQVAAHMLSTCGFPSSLLLSANQAIGMLAWNCVSLLPFEKRYAMYYQAVTDFRIEPLDCSVRESKQSQLKAKAFAGLPSTRTAITSQGSTAAEAEVKVEPQKTSGVNGLPAMLRSQRYLVDNEVGRMMRRMTMPSDKDERKKVILRTSRMLTKLACSNPFVVAARIRYQSVNYQNQQGMLVEMLNLFSPMQLDIVLFEILRYLTCTEQERIGRDRTNLTEWLINISTLLAQLLKQYNVLDLTAVSQYLFMQLLEGDKPHDIIILHDLLTHLVGIHVVADLSPKQLVSLAGGSMLKAVQLMLPPDVWDQKVLRNRCAQLIDSMQQGDDEGRHLAAPILITLCQQRPLLLQGFSAANVKLVSELYDRTQVTLQQFLLCLREIPQSMLLKLLPPFKDLWQVYKLDPETIMTIYRPLIKPALRAWTGTTTPAEGSPGVPLSMDRFIELVCEQVPSLQDSAIQISAKFYLVFWGLELQDIVHPETSYQETLVTLDKELNRLQIELISMQKDHHDQKKQAQGPPSGGGGYSTMRGGYSGSRPEKEIVTQADITKKEAEIACTRTALAAIPGECSEQKVHVAATLKFVDEHKDEFFPGVCVKDADVKKICSVLFQECIIPRCTNSQEDALFCAHFIDLLSRMKPLNYYFIFMLECVFKDAISLMRCCTDREAELLTIFIKQVLHTVNTYDREECFSEEETHPYDTWRMRVPDTPGNPTTKSQAKANAFSEYPDFVKLSSKWQTKTVGQLATFISRMSDTGDTCVRNALKMSIALVPSFPTHMDTYKLLDNAVNGLLNGKNIPMDIKQLAFAGRRTLDSIAPSCKMSRSVWLEARVKSKGRFTNIVEAPKEDDRDGGTVNTTKLRADAKAFVPGHKTNTETGEVEDGEVPDELPSETKGGHRGDARRNEKRSRPESNSHVGSDSSRQHQRARTDLSQRQQAPMVRREAGGMRSDNYTR